MILPRINSKLKVRRLIRRNSLFILIKEFELSRNLGNTSTSRERKLINKQILKIMKDLTKI